MAVKRLTERTIYVADCACGKKVVLTDNPPREHLCDCGTWVKFVEQSYVGPDRFDKK